MIDLESYISSVERVADYTKLCPEFETKNAVSRDVSAFSRGKIVFQNVSLSYTEKDSVLKNLDFTINPKEKIGIVGRTGAGTKRYIFSQGNTFYPKAKVPSSRHCSDWWRQLVTFSLTTPI